MKKIILAAIAAIILASCQSPVLTYDAKARKYVEKKQETATVKIVIE